MPARRGRLRDLCALWHQSLTTHGVKDYTLSDAWADVQLASLRCLSSVLLLHNWQLDPNIGSRAILLNDEWIERCCALVVELDALELLRHVREDAPQPLPIGPGRVPRDLETIALRCLQKDRDARFANMGELADALVAALGGELPSTMRASLPPQMQPVLRVRSRSGEVEVDARRVEQIPRLLREHDVVTQSAVFFL